MVRRTGNRYAPPARTGPRYRDVVQSLADAVQHLVTPHIRTHEFRPLLEQLQQRITVLAETEEIILLLLADQWLAVEWRLELIFLRFVLGQILLLPRVIPAFI